jgi:transcriptional regulator with XRE-family HTH domain
MAVNHIPAPLESDSYNRLDRNEAMPKKDPKEIEGETFGRRLARLRKEAGYSQRALADEIGISYRMVAYYEAQTTHPPANLLPTIADALGISVDQLLGHRSIRAKKAPTNERLLRQLRQVEKLPPHARRSVLEHIDGLVAKYGSRG